MNRYYIDITLVGVIIAEVSSGGSVRVFFPYSRLQRLIMETEPLIKSGGYIHDVKNCIYWFWKIC